MKFKKLFQNIFLSHIENILYYHFASFVGWKIVFFLSEFQESEFRKSELFSDVW